MVSVSRKVKPDRATRRADVRTRLLTTASQMLEEGRSFTEITVEELITAADVARSTFYAHFEDKGVLLLGMVEHITAEFEVAASRWYHLPGDATRQELRDALGILMEAYVQHRPRLAAVMEAATYDPRVRAEYDQAIERRFAQLHHCLLAQQRAGGLRQDVDIATVTPWLGWMVERGLFQLLASRPSSFDKQLDGMTTVLWNALYDGARSPE